MSQLLKCDSCGETVEHNCDCCSGGFLQVSFDEHVGDEHVTTHVDFCSPLCLAAWASTKAEQVAEAAPERP